MKKIFRITVLICVMVLGLSPETISAQEGQNLSYDTFVQDLVKGLDEREQYGTEATANINEENATSDQAMQIYSDIAGQEWNILQKYAGTQFDANDNISKNQEYKRQVYMEGLQQQVEAKERAAGDWQEFLDEWEKGYLKRARVVVEIAAYEGNPELDRMGRLLADMKNRVGNACEQGTQEVYEIQKLLPGVVADRQPGDNTLCALKDFEKEKGMDINGVICEDLIRLVREKVTGDAQ